MHDLEQVLEQRLIRLSGQRHLLLLLRESHRSIPTEDPAAIVSRIPDLRLERGDELFAGHRRRLWFQSKGAYVTLLARIRTPPCEDSAVHLEQARDRLGRCIPVAALDLRKRTLHILVDLRDASILDTSPGLDSTELIFDALLERPIQRLLEDDGPPRVGAQVAERVRALLQALAARRQAGQALLGKELSVLERLADEAALPALLARRLQSLRQAMGRAPKQTADSMIEPDELGRLQLLVRKRACAALRFGDHEICGVLNPSLFMGCRLKALSFQLDLDRSLPLPVLRVRDPVRDVGESMPLCLGAAADVFRSFQRGGDLYGVVDTVLNFVETNHVGAGPIARPGRRPPL